MSMLGWATSSPASSQVQCCALQLAVAICAPVGSVYCMIVDMKGALLQGVSAGGPALLFSLLSFGEGAAMVVQD